MSATPARRAGPADDGKLCLHRLDWPMDGSPGPQGSAAMRYIVAVIVAGLLVAGGILFVRQTYRGVEQEIRQSLLREKQAGTLPPEFQNVDIESGKLPDMQISLPAGLDWRIKVSMWLEDFWHILAPLTVAICLAVAFLLGRKGMENR